MLCTIIFSDLKTGKLINEYDKKRERDQQKSSLKTNKSVFYYYF